MPMMGGGAEVEMGAAGGPFGGLSPPSPQQLFFQQQQLAAYQQALQAAAYQQQQAQQQAAAAQQQYYAALMTARAMQGAAPAGAASPVIAHGVPLGIPSPVGMSPMMPPDGHAGHVPLQEADDLMNAWMQYAASPTDRLQTQDADELDSASSETAASHSPSPAKGGQDGTTLYV